jgi:hypothetical protein
MGKDRTRQKRSSTLPLFLLLAAVIATWALYGLVVYLFPFRGEFWDARGKFGDMFGAFNALFTACAFAALLYGIRLEYKAFRRQELHSALSGQLDTLVELHARPAAEREPVWRAIVTAPGGPGEGFPIERAIAVQIEAMDRLLAGEDLDEVPTYGRLPDAAADSPRRI